MKIKRGMRFEHPSFIIGSPKDPKGVRPDICTVTRVAQGTVFYHTENDMKMRTTVEALENLTNAKRIKWLED